MDLGGIDIMAGGTGFNTNWDDPAGPRTYGDKGNMTYDEWMQSKGYTPGSYGPGDSGYKNFVESGGGWIKPSTKSTEQTVALGNRGETASVSNEKLTDTSKTEQKQEANSNEITNNYEKPADLNWITGGEVSEEDKSKGYDLETYLFSKGMLEGNQLDDYGEPTGWYGGIETPVSLKKEAEESLKYTKKDTPKYKQLQDEIAGYDKAINAYKKYVDTFKSNYEADENKNKYEQKEDSEARNVRTEAEKSVDIAWDALLKKQAEWTKTLQDLGLDWVDYEDIDAISELEQTLTSEVNDLYDAVNNDALNAAVNNGTFTGKYFSKKGNEVDISWDNTGLGSLVSGGARLGSATIGNQKYEIIRNNAGKVGDVTITDYKGKPAVALSGFVTNVSDDVSKKNLPVAIHNIVQEVEKDALERGVENVNTHTALANANKNANIVLSKINIALNNVTNAAKAVEEGEANLEKATSEWSKYTHNTAKELQQKTMDEYAAGKISAFEAANRLANIEDSMLDINMNSIVSKINPETYLGIGSVGEDTISKGAFMYDLSNPKETGTASLISQIEDLTQLRQEVDKIDISTINSTESADKAVTDINEISSQYTKVANTKLESLVKDLLQTGADLQTIRDNPRYIEFSQQIFDDAQAIYEKTSEIEQVTAKYDLNLTKREIKKDLAGVSKRVDELQEQTTNMTGSYYSPGSNMGGTQITGITLDKKEVKALAKYANSIQATKDAAIALMKSAAFNGAENTPGGEFTEDWKMSKSVQVDKSFKGGIKNANEKTLTWRDWFAAASRGTLGTVATVLGAGLTAVNPGVGLMLASAGLGMIGKGALDVTTKMVGANTTNEEKMFARKGTGATIIDTGTEKDSVIDNEPVNEFHIGNKATELSGDKREVTAKDVINEISNRTNESANFGDVKSVGTHTKTAGATIEIITGLIGLTSGNLAGLVVLGDGINELRTAMKGGLENNLDTTISNVYNLGSNIMTWAKMNNIDINEYMENPKGQISISASPENLNVVQTGSGPAVSDYGSITPEDNAGNAEGKYSGFIEEAKNKNVATDYNAGMEQETNEAVSDEKVKGYVVRIYKSEPDWFRKAIDKVLKMHSEREW